MSVAATLSCGARVEALLKRTMRRGAFWNANLPAAGHSRNRPRIAEAPGTVIGPYKLLEQIGEGGFGIVYMADQQAPVRRRVALKIIKPGMDTRQVLARFKAELQALSLMDHPNIARALDAGATDSGRPYFVMELVRGVPITDYCDQNNLPVHERLDLFVQVCHAVQHAHQKGIIHRDIKPSNVLVTLHDGRPVPKVIDFGVAKAINQQLTPGDAVHALRRDDRHAALHEPRTGRDDQPGYRHAQRHLLAGRAFVRVAHRQHAVRQRSPAQGGLRRDPPHHPRGGAAQAEPADQHVWATRGPRWRLIGRPTRTA